MEFWTAEPSTRECTPPAALAQARALSVHAMLHSALQRTHRATATPAHPPSFPVHRPSAHTFALSHSPPEHSGRGARGAQGRGEARRVCTHMQARTHTRTHTLSHAPPAPLDVPSPPRPRRAERGGTRQWQMTAAPRCAPPPRASLSSPFFSLMPPPHAPRQADRAPSQAAGLSPFFLFFASSTPSHPDTIGRPPSRGRSSSRCK